MTGPIIAILAAILFGLSAPVAKNLLGQIDAWLLAGLLYFGSGVGMFLIFNIRKLRQRTEPSFKISKKDLLWPMCVTLFGGVFGPILLMYGLSHTQASTASLLLNLEGVLTAALAWVVFHEHYDRRIILGMASIVIGSIVLTWSSDFSITFLSGPIFISAACFCWAIDNNLTRKISLNDPVFLTLIKSLIAGTTNIILAFTFGSQIPKFGLLVEAGVLGFLCYGLSIVCFILALRKLGASRTGAYFSSAPFVGAILSILIRDEQITQNFLVAALFMLVGIYLHISEVHEHSHTHEEMEHEHSHFHDEHHQHDHDPAISLNEPHTHKHVHKKLTHKHKHFPDMHHTHTH